MSTAAKGRRFEHRVRDHLRHRGWWVVRAAASQGETKADLVAFRDDGAVALVQCKAGAGRVTKIEWDTIWAVSTWNDTAVAVIAMTSDTGQLELFEILGEKVPYSRDQYIRPWDPGRVR